MDEALRRGGKWTPEESANGHGVFTCGRSSELSRLDGRGRDAPHRFSVRAASCPNGVLSAEFHGRAGAGSDALFPASRQFQ